MVQLGHGMLSQMFNSIMTVPNHSDHTQASSSILLNQKE